LDFDNDIGSIFDIFNGGYDLKSYISDVFEEIFKYAFKCVNREGDFIKNFCKKINYDNLFIRSEAEFRLF